MIAGTKRSCKFLVLVLLGAGLSLSLLFRPTIATAAHCPVTSDKEHLDGTSRCGYYVQPVLSPSPSSTPSPLPTQPVRVENEPQVKVAPTPHDPSGTMSAYRVHVTNFRAFAQTETEGWNDYDRDVLEAIAAMQNRTHLLLVLCFGITLFSLAGLLVFTVRRGS
jgi:hypothetical protein